MSGKLEIGKGKKKEGDAVKGVAIATGVKWSGGRKPRADNEYRRRSWKHPSEALVARKVVYKCKFLGAVDVKDPKGMHIVKGTIDKLKLVTETMRTAGVKIKDCELAISIAGVTAIDTLTKNILQSHPLTQISFSADDRRSHGNIFAYIARPVPKSKEHTCYVYESEEHKAEEIVTTIGQAFEVAYQRFKDTQKAQEDFKALKAGLRSPEEKEAFTKKLMEVQKQATEMERESAQRRKPPLQKQPSAIAKWENITHALQPFAQEPSMDPGTMYLVPRPQTEELDVAISQMNSMISSLEEGFCQPMTVVDSKGAEEELVMSQYVMEDIEGGVKSMQVESDKLEEPNLPANYQMEEYIKARTMPKEGMVKEVSSHWEQKRQ